MPAPESMRIAVTHADMTSMPRILRTDRAGDEHLIVFWRADVPLGHVYARTDGEGRLPLRTLSKDFSDRLSRPPPHVPGAQVSVVICTRDRPAALRDCLASLLLQSRKPQEIVVVDNASATGETRAVAEHAGVRYVREDRPGLDFARNAGVREATGDIVAFTDDDVKLHPKWLERLTDAFERPDIMATTGLILPGELETPSQIYFEKNWGFGRGYRRRDFDSQFFSVSRRHGCPVWTIGAGASMAFRRRAFDEVGYFDERLDVGAAGCSGDSEFWFRLLAAGWTCRYEPTAVAFHFHRREHQALREQIVAYMRGHVAALLVQFERHRDWGSLRRVLLDLPKYYLRRAGRRIVRPVEQSDLLADEIKGALSGIAYYIRTPRQGTS
jgi:GT2 family glycosyltransferase